MEERAPYFTKMFSDRVIYNWDGVDGGGDFWLFIPPAAEAEGTKYLVKPIADPYREIEDRYTTFDSNSTTMQEGADFLRQDQRNGSREAKLRLWLRATGRETLDSGFGPMGQRS